MQHLSKMMKMPLGCVHVLNMNFAYCKIYDDALSRTIDQKE